MAATVLLTKQGMKLFCCICVRVLRFHPALDCILQLGFVATDMLNQHTTGRIIEFIIICAFCFPPLLGDTWDF